MLGFYGGKGETRRPCFQGTFITPTRYLRGCVPTLRVHREDSWQGLAVGTPHGTVATSVARCLLREGYALEQIEFRTEALLFH